MMNISPVRFNAQGLNFAMPKTVQQRGGANISSTILAPNGLRQQAERMLVRLQGISGAEARAAEALLGEGGLEAAKLPQVQAFMAQARHLIH